MSTKKYVSLSKLSTFLDNLKTKFAPVGHTHTVSDLTDYAVDTVLSSVSTNPVQNKVLNDEFDSIATAMAVLEASLDSKSDASHTHVISDVTNLQSALDSINDTLSQKSAIQFITWGADD